MWPLNVERKEIGMGILMDDDKHSWPADGSMAIAALPCNRGRRIVRLASSMSGIPYRYMTEPAHFSMTTLRLALILGPTMSI